MSDPLQSFARQAEYSRPSPDVSRAARRDRNARLVLWLAIAVFVVFRLGWLERFMVHVDDFVPMAEHLRQRANPWSVADIVSLSGSYTYPPGQFLLSLPLAAGAGTFNDLLFWYRLPSLLFWLAGLWLLWRLIRLLWPDMPRESALLPVALGALSWRGFVESSQGYNYATTGLVAGCVALVVATERGRGWVNRGPRAAALTGMGLGLLPWLSYQALFVVAAGLAALAVDALWRRQWRSLGLACVVGAGFVLPFAAVAWMCLRPAMSWASGTPAWAGGVPPADLAGRLLFPFRAWFETIQSNLTVTAWGLGSAVVALLAIATIATGLWLAARRPDSRERNRPLLLYLALVTCAFTLGPYLKLFPLGASRHSFILQVPLLLALAFALAEIRPSRAVIAVTLVLLAGAWAISLPGQLDAVRNRVDFEQLATEFSRAPDTRITDLPGACTWEYTFLARAEPARLERMRWCLQFQAPAEQAAWLMQSRRGLLVSHRGPLSPDFRRELRAAGALAVTPLAEVPPGRGPELKGRLNGGNGYFLYLVER